MSLLIGGMFQELADQGGQPSCPGVSLQSLRPAPPQQPAHKSRATSRERTQTRTRFPLFSAAGRSKTANRPPHGGWVAALAGRPAPRNTSTAASWAGTHRSGVGAGLDGRCCRREAAADAIRRDGIVFVRVGKPSPRQVPVLARWEGVVCDLAPASAGNEFLVRGQSFCQEPGLGPGHEVQGRPWPSRNVGRTASVSNFGTMPLWGVHTAR
jgi:hypothetical protein